jgi:putative ABC transport system permease protein
MLGWSFERTLVYRLTHRFRADLIVSSAFVAGGYRAAPASDALVEGLRRIPGVAVVVGNQARDVEYGAGRIALDVYDRDCFTDRRACDWPLDPGALPHALRLVANGQALMASSTFAHQYGVRPGDTVRLSSPNGALALGVAAVTSGQAENAVVLSRDLYRRSWNDSFVYLAHVVLDPGTDPTTAKAAIARELGHRYRLLVRSTAELIEYFAGQARQAFSLFYLMEAITFLLVVIGMGDTLLTGVVERTREFGMMRAIGLHRSGLFGMVMLEGLAIGVLGLLLAAAAGLTLGVFWVDVQFPALLGWTLYLHFPAGFALTAAVLTMLLCLAGSLLPSLRAARLSVPAALRNE